jgi:soluble lytic murein transglycosylase-like protein
MSTILTQDPAARSLARHGVAYAGQIASAASKFGLDPRLLAAVAAQETGGPGSNAGRNVVGDGGHGHGLFQIDDRFHGFARTAAAMDPQANADYAARMIAGLLKQYGGDVHKALSAYNAGNPNAPGTTTAWQDGRCLGYADSVMRHYAALAGESPETLQQALCAESPGEVASVNTLSALAARCPQQAPHRWHSPSEDFAAVIDGDDPSD